MKYLVKDMRAILVVNKKEEHKFKKYLVSSFFDELLDDEPITVYNARTQKEETYEVKLKRRKETICKSR